MSEACKRKTLSEVIVQENGIIRNKNGYLIGKLVDSVEFESLGKSEEMKSPYTKEEKKIMDALVEAVAYFRKLKMTHPSHEHDFVDGIHKCQNVIMHRIVQRDYPKIFPTYDEEKNETI